LRGSGPRATGRELESRPDSDDRLDAANDAELGLRRQLIECHAGFFADGSRHESACSHACDRFSGSEFADRWHHHGDDRTSRIVQRVRWFGRRSAVTARHRTG
jgi:hypothetical protein